MNDIYPAMMSPINLVYTLLFIGFFGGMLGFHYLLFLRFFWLNKMDVYMCKSHAHKYRAVSGKKISFFVFSGDVIMSYSSGCALDVLWNRITPDLDKKSVPLHLRRLFAPLFWMYASMSITWLPAFIIDILFGAGVSAEIFL